MERVRPPAIYVAMHKYRATIAVASASLARLSIALQRAGQVLLLDPVVAIGVGVEIALAVAKAFLVPAGVAQVGGHLALTLVLDRGQGLEKGHLIYRTKKDDTRVLLRVDWDLAKLIS